MVSEILRAAALASFGTLEGYAFVRTGLVNPNAIHDQFQFKSFIVMKLFLSAVGTSCLVQSAMHIWDKQRFFLTRDQSRMSIGYPRAIGGLALVGTGMALAGAGPTLMPAQAGAGNETGIYAILGGLLGGLFYATFLQERFFNYDTCARPGEKTALDDHKNYAAWAIPMGTALLGATAGLEYVFPYVQEAQRYGIQNPWMPIVAGMVVGANQLPLRYLYGKGQGGSTSVMNIIGTATRGALAKDKQLKDVKSAGQLIYVYVGTTVGAYVAAQTVGYVPVESLGAARTMLGGALAVIGARVADGCTCGHGITGMSELSYHSIAGAMAIFGAGIAASQFI